ncbi:MAG: hypothetical protein AUJ52_06680 [Elusimicrobia bacterium CG1_02_63_36]|nr:MAG: hypothetical protein AUJ52_06680 [Elusimicrobia bacterium CG1_02_63_36]PJA11962.1 MAG: hypothetical protein COX66_18440 [Elusimicrobia bacterium CG_4_10_14_0_2_um_filter_63_34]PJB23793.1 MAG: hypothetical protein CO113_16900 [Elusimicrobia bacterium CG_4_9_14_3_um_filter_62_55]
MIVHRGRALTGWAWIATLPVLLFPVGDPDLWWHLHAAKRLLADGSWPRTEVWSFTIPGAPWVNFEWLGQLAYYAAYQGGGIAGVWLLKALLLAAAALGVQFLLSRIGIGVQYRALGTALWITAAAPRADARIELFSIAAFSWLLCGLETRRRRGIPAGSERSLALFGAAAGALWANLHGGFVYGFALLGAYALHDSLERRGRGLWWAFGGAVFGTALNPYGLGLHALLWRHAAEAASLQGLILEWAPLDPTRPSHWPTWFFLITTMAALGALWRGRRRVPPLAAVLLGLFGMAALRHARAGIFFVTLAIAYLPLLALKARKMPRVTRRTFQGVAVLLAALGAFGLWIGAPVRTLRAVHHREFWPVRAADFMEREREFRDLRVYNAWGWGGYLGYRFGDAWRIFQDGRYVFHPLLLEAREGIASPEAWTRFLGRYGVEAALMENAPLKVASTREYPDGTRRVFQRPFYLSFMPREKWALVYWDAQALLFVRREVLEVKRMSALEYKLARPGDEEALADALARGEIDTDLLAKERERYAKTTALPESPLP